MVSEEPSSSVLDVRGSSSQETGGYQTQHMMGNAQMRFQNLPNRSDFSPSGITSGFDERESPERFAPGNTGIDRRH